MGEMETGLDNSLYGLVLKTIWQQERSEMAPSGNGNAKACGNICQCWFPTHNRMSPT